MSKKAEALSFSPSEHAIEEKIPERTERRESKRIPFYRGEFPEATIIIGGKSYLAEVFDLSSRGIGVVPKGEIPGLDSLSQKVMVSVGKSTPREAILKNVSHIKFAGSLRLKLGMFTPEWENVAAAKDELFSCADSMPLAYCDDPIAFNRTILFNVSHFSKNGLVLRTKRVEGAFFPGLVIDLKLMMPARGEFESVVEVTNLHRGEGTVDLYCQWRSEKGDLMNAVSEFLLMTVSGLTIKGLRDSGFLVADLEKAFLFKHAQTPQEIEEILKLRLVAAKGEGRWLDTDDHTVMRDKWDSYARQIYCEVNGQIVAASRIVFNNGLKERSEHVNYHVAIPEWLWTEGFVEASRVCTHPSFRGTDVFARMVQQMSHIVTQSGHRFLLMNCVDSLVPVYKKFAGVTSLHQKFNTPFMQKDKLNLLYIDVRSLQLATNAKALSWSIHAPIAEHSVERGHIKLNLAEKGLRTLFRPLHWFFFRMANKRKYEKAATARDRQNMRLKTTRTEENGESSSNPKMVE